MELSQYFKSIVDQERAAVVICNLEHEIIYMNPAAAARYAKHGSLVGASLLDCHSVSSNEKIKRSVEWFAEEVSHNIVYTFRNEKEKRDVYMVALRDEDGKLIGYYEKHECRADEIMKMYDFS